MKNFQYLGTQIVPTEFTVVGYAFREQCDENEFEAVVELNNMRDEQDVEWLTLEMVSQVHNKTNCNHCNRRIRNIVVAQHDGGTYHTFGHDCGGNLSEFNQHQFEDMVQRSMLAKKRAKKRAKNQAIRDAFLDQHPGLREALTTDNKIVADISESFTKYMTLSEKQIELVFKLHERAKQYELEKLNMSTPVPTGKLKGQQMEVVSVKRESTKDAYSGQPQLVFKMLLKHPDGYRIYGKITADIVWNKDTQEYDGLSKPYLASISAGDKVTFCGDLTPSDKDEFFGFFKRGKIEI